MAEFHEIEVAIRDVVMDRFSDAKISLVKIEKDTDSDGDPIWNILIVFEGKKDKETLDPHKMSGLTRHIIDKLIEIESMEAFPLVSFMSSKDAKKLNLEAA